MKKNVTSLILIFAFVLLLGGAYVLYNNLGQEAAPDQLSVAYGQNSTSSAQQTSAPVETTEASEPETTVPQEDDDKSDYILAPDFTVYDIDGNEVHLSDYLGKPIVLNFWASWCGPCKREMPDFNEAYLELGEDVHFLMVNVTTGRETLDSASSFIEEQGYEFPVFYDTSSVAAATYGAYSLPTSFFIDADGYIIAHALGSIGRETLQKGINMIFTEGM